MEVNILLLILFIKVCGIFTYEDEHIHFKVHVPEIIKHHVHTHTVYIHAHHPAKAKKPKKTEHSYDGQEDWDVYNTYSKHTSYGEEYGTGGETGGPDGDQLTTQYPSLLSYKNMDQGEPPIAFYDDFRGGYPEPKHIEQLKTFNDGVSGYKHSPGHVNANYQVIENVNETSPPHQQSNYEESKKSGGELQHGYLFNSNIENVYNNKIEQSSENIGDEGEEQNYRHLETDYMRRRNG